MSIEDNDGRIVPRWLIFFRPKTLVVIALFYHDSTGPTNAPLNDFYLLRFVSRSNFHFLGKNFVQEYYF